MNIPADLPSPDQENVYYSVKSIETEFSKYFTQEKIKILSPKLKEYYYPTFVFDDSNAPNSYQLVVHPKNGSIDSILLDSTGSIMMEKKLPPVPITRPKVEDLEDDASPVQMDPSFYSTSQLKHSDFFTDLLPDMETTPGVELLVGSKFWLDSNYAKEREQFHEIAKNIVTNTLKSLPKEELQALEEKFETVEG